MGMYTELVFGASLKQETPTEVINTLMLLLDHEQGNENQPYNQGIVNGRNILRGSSYYFGVSNSHSILMRDSLDRCWILSSRASIKNYQSEIETFLEWIKPWVETGSGGRELYAMVMYEEASEPTLYYLHEKSIYEE